MTDNSHPSNATVSTVKTGSCNATPIDWEKIVEFISTPGKVLSKFQTSVLRRKLSQYFHFKSGKEMNSLTHSLNGNQDSLTTLANYALMPRAHNELILLPVSGPIEDPYVYRGQGLGYITLAYRGYGLDVDFSGQRCYIICSYRVRMEDVRRIMVRTNTFSRLTNQFVIQTTNTSFYFLRVVLDNEETWSIASRVRNRLAHSLTGNPPKKFKQPKTYSFVDADLFAFRREYVRVKRSDLSQYYADKAGHLNDEGLKLLTGMLKIAGCDMSSSREHFLENVRQGKRSALIEYRKSGYKSHEWETLTDYCMNLFFDNRSYQDLFDKQSPRPYSPMEEKYDSPKKPQLTINTLINDKLPSPVIISEQSSPSVIIVPPTVRAQDLPSSLPPTTKASKRFTFDVSPNNPKIGEKSVSPISTVTSYSPPTPPSLPQKPLSKRSPPPIPPRPKLRSKSPSFPSLTIQVPPSGTPAPTIPPKPVVVASPTIPVVVDHPIVPLTMKGSSSFPKLDKQPVSTLVTTAKSVRYNSTFDGKLHDNLINVTKSPEPPIVRSFDEPEYDVKDFIEMNIVEIKNESVKTMLSLTTPDFISDMSSRELYLVPIEEKIRVPVDFLDYSVKFWNGRSFSVDDLNLLRIDIVKYASDLTLTHSHFDKLLIYGPTISMHYYHNVYVRVNPVVRQERQEKKWIKMYKAFYYFLYFIMFIIEVIKPVRVLISDLTLNVRYANKYFPSYRIRGVTMPNFFGHWLERIKPSLNSGPVIYNRFGLHFQNPFRPLIDYFWTILYELNIATEVPLPASNIHITGMELLPANLFMMVNIPLCKFQLLRIFLSNPISCFLSPVIEEYNRNLFSTIFLSCLEWGLCGIPFTAILHVTNYLISKLNFKHNLIVRIGLHIIFNVLAINCKMFTASSFLGSLVCWNLNNLVPRLTHRKLLNQRVHPNWSLCDKLPMITYPEKLKNIVNEQQKSGVVDMNFSLKTEKTQFQYVVGPKRKDYLPIAFAPNKINEFAALKARVLKDTPLADKLVLEDFHSWLKRNYKRIFPITSHSKIKPLEFSKYLQNSNASPGVKKKLYRQNMKFEQEGINHDTKLTYTQIKKWCMRESFVKTENLNYRTPNGILDKSPRLIQGGKKEFICIVGPWISALQNYIKQDWNCKNFICFTSGVKARDAAKLVSQFPIWMEDDVSAWDASCCEKLLEIEAWLFQKFGAPRAVLQLIQKNVNTIGITSRGLLYWRKGCRKSGDPYTSLGNSILNGLIHLYIYCKHHKIGIKKCRKIFHMLVQGDDSLINLKEVDSINWKHEMLKFGFKSIGTYKHHMDDVEFCSSRFYKNNKEITFGPIPGKVIAKFGVFCSPPIDLDPYDILYGSAVGLKYASDSVPILNKYVDNAITMASKLRKLDSYKKNTIKKQKRVSEMFLTLQGISQPWRMNYTQQAIDSQTLSLLTHRYSYSSLMEIKINKEIDNLSCITYNDPKFLNYIVDNDTSGPFLYCRDNASPPTALMF